MTSIEKKAIQHASKLLKSVDSFDVNRAIIKVLTDMKVSDDVHKNVVDALGKSFSIENAKIKEATGWIDTLLSDHP